MIFHSLDFVLFLLAVLIVYWALPHRAQNLLLLGVNYFFYGYIHPWFLSLLAATTLMDFLCGLGMERYPAYRRAILCASLVVSLTLLSVFKYYGFFVENVAAILNLAGLPSFTNTLRVFLPVGISFYTFQSIAYVVDVYRGKLKPSHNLLEYALYVSFFPQLVAGPIERGAHMLPQFQGKRFFDPVRAQSAISLLVWGFFKKLVIADNAALICNKVFALENPGFPVLWAGVFAFCVQIFADFSAYTDIARGTARLLGIELMENFRHPYVSQSPSEFWQRWHISLSTWIRDYIYIPLGGSRAKPMRAAFNLLATFFLSGLWHGAQWNFVLWGLWWGTLILIERALAPLFPEWIRSGKWLAPFRILLVFGITNVGWLLFRETNSHYLWKYFTLDPFAATSLQWSISGFLVTLTLLYSLPIWIHHASAFLPARCWQRLEDRPGILFAVRTALAATLFLGILLFRSTVSADFIYFQF